MVTLAVASRRVVRPRSSRRARDPRRPRRRRRPAARGRATSLRRRPRPGPATRASTTRREWPRRAFGPLGPAQMVPWLGQYWAPHLLGAHVQRPLRRPLARRRAAPTRRRTGAPRSPTTGGGARRRGRRRFAGGRVHGVAPTAVAAWTPDEVDHARAAARAHASPAPAAASGTIRAQLAALARRDRGRGHATRCSCPSRSRTSAGSRCARATTCSAALQRARPARPAAVVRGRVGLGGASRTALRRVVHDQQRDVVLAALARGPARAARGRRPRPAASRTSISASRSRSSPSSIARVALLDQAVRVEHDRRARRDRRRRGARTRRRRRPAAGPGAAPTNAGGRRAARPAAAGARRARTSAAASPGRRSPASTVAIGRSSSAGARTLRVREHAVGRVAVVGVGGEHGAQLAHARGGLRRRGPSRRRSRAAARPSSSGWAR